MLAYANRPATILRVRNVSEKAIARHPRQSKVRIASPEVGDGKIIDMRTERDPAIMQAEPGVVFIGNSSSRLVVRILARSTKSENSLRRV
jgi:hypothetical protein